MHEELHKKLDEINEKIDIALKRLDMLSDKKSTKRFVKPCIEDVEKYCIERCNGINAYDFVNYYESRGWKIGKNPMKDWKAAIRTWENRKKQQEPKETLLDMGGV